MKANTLEHLLIIDGVKSTGSGTNKNDLIKIKLEVDTNPPLPAGEQEVLFLLEPIPFSYRILTLPSLFGGKLHALICREYKGGRIKGRDYYDFIWYISKNVKPDLGYLKGKLCESGIWKIEDEFTLGDLKRPTEIRRGKMWPHLSEMEESWKYGLRRSLIYSYKSSNKKSPPLQQFDSTGDRICHKIHLDSFTQSTV